MRISEKTSNVNHEGATLKARVIVLENYDLDSLVCYLEENCRHYPAFRRLLDMYRVKRSFPDMSHFRLGPNMFEKIFLNWIIFVGTDTPAGAGELIGHGVTTGISWGQEQKTLPDGWQGAVRQSYQDINLDRKPANTHVGLFILIEESSRKHGWAGNVILEMKAVAKKNGITALIIPLRPPSRYKKEYAAMPMSEFASLKREDGQPMDHWIRLHVRLGAKIIGVSNTSHQHAFSLKDFYGQVPVEPVTKSGYTLVQHKDGGWYNVYVDLEREFVLINQGCVWVQHPV